MASRFTEADIERVRSSTDIASVVGRFVQLRKAGRSYKGLCPFHKEKTPSFFVSPERQTWHCFGCGAGGDVFSFLIEYLNLSFPEVVEELASEAGIELVAVKDQSYDRTETLRRVTARTQDFFRRSYESDEGADARRYVAGRGLADCAGELGIGFAADGNRLLRHLRDEGFSESVLIESGMVQRSDSGSGLYDRFRNRVTFPITDRRGRPVSFGARLLGDGEPKYLNGPETPVYSKGSLLYGYRTALRAARDLDLVILVEGYFDHARLWSAGFHSTVATCGTALTPAQARQLGSISGDVLVCYDPDRAGNRAAVRAAEVLLGEGFYPRIVGLPEGQDPDDFVRDRGADSMWERIRSAGNPVEFCIDLLGGWDRVPAGKRQVDVIRRLVRTASAARDPVMRENLLRTIADRTGYSFETLSQETEAMAREERPRGPSRGTGLTGRDRDLLRALLLADDLDAGLLEALGPEDFSSEAGRDAFTAIRLQARSGGTGLTLASMGEEVSRVCAGLMTESEPLTDRDLETIMSEVARGRLERERKRLQSELAGADEEGKTRILRELGKIGSKLAGAGDAGKR
jgi:DNA primase